MGGRLRLARAGGGATIQDGGRFGFQRFGVTPAGPMDWIAHAIANRAVGNAPDAAAFEFGAAGAAVVCEHEPLWIAYAGGGFLWSRNGTRLPAAALLRLEPGERLEAKAGPWGLWCYLAVAGGLDVPTVLGSRSTHVPSHLGGVEGRMLQPGDAIAAPGTATQTGRIEAAIASPALGPSEARLRAIPGPQDDYFTAEAQATFFSAAYRVSSRFDRMAYRLDGPPLAHAKGYNIVSDGVAQGSIQVPGDGQPLALMADRQPTGGYPKIATIVRADIGRLAQRRPGEAVSFERSDAASARPALLSVWAEIERIDRQLEPLRPVLDSEYLLSRNLIGGVHTGQD